MSTAEPDKPGEVRDDLVHLRTVYQAELSAARKNLGAEISDLEQLLAPIHARQVPCRQVSELLKQAYLRLQKLRESEAELSDLGNKAPGIAVLVKQAGRALQNGETFSLEEADQALEKAYRRGLELDDEGENVALVRARQAQIAATKQEYRRAVELYAEAAATPGLDAPRQWRYQNERALVLADLGREFMDNAALAEAIDLYENTGLALAPREERRDDWATTQNNLGNALGVLGQRQRGTRMLERSVAAFEKALSERSRERLPLDWATTQNNLGNALGVLGQRQGDTRLLEKSAEAFECALQERSRERTPQDWATTQNNLGAVLQTLGQRNKDTKLLKRSVEAYKSVLQEWTRQRVPLDWATTLHNLGTALRTLGEHRKGPRTLEQAVAAYNSALAERTRDRVPQDWALTQNNLGAALQILGKRQDDPQKLKESIAAYENALKEWTRERMPMGWAMTKANLGVARRTLAERTRDFGISRMAVADLEAAVDVFRNASHAHYTELGEEQLAKARAFAEGLAGG